MPVSSRDLLEAVAVLVEQRNMRATVKNSLKGAVVCGTACFIGGCVAGPVGLAVGGTIGAVSSYAMTKGKFKSVASIIREDLTIAQREMLYDDLKRVLSQLHPTDLAIIIPLLMSQQATQMAVLNTVTSFITNEMRLQIVD